jgi:hypothetical protein
MSPSKARNKKLARRAKQRKKAQPRTRAMALNIDRDADKRLTIDPLPAPATPDSTRFPPQPVKSEPEKPDPPLTVKGTQNAGEERAPTAATEEGPFDFGFATQIATTLLWSPVTMVLRQQALLPQLMLSLRYPKKSGQPE